MAPFVLRLISQLIYHLPKLLYFSPYLLHTSSITYLLSQVVEDSGVDKAFVYQIFNGSKRPSRDKLIDITFGMHLNEEETQRVLKIAGHSELYPRVCLLYTSRCV